LRGYTEEAIVVFDADEAGISAALKSLPLFLNEGMGSRAVSLPKGHDPDSFVNTEGVEALQGLLDDAPSLFEFYLAHRLEASSEIDGKVKLLKEMIPVIAAFQDATQRSVYVRHLAERAGVREDMIWSQLRGGTGRVSGRSLEKNLRTGLDASSSGNQFNDVHIVNLLIHHPGCAEGLMQSDWEVLLSDKSTEEIVERFILKYRQEGAFSPEHLLDSLDNDATRERFREALLMPSFYGEEAAEQAVVDFQGKIHQVKLSRSIRSARDRGDLKDLNTLLKSKAETLQRS
jgi:DNA primase